MNAGMPSNYWLVKQEPESYSWADFVKEGNAAWTGIRNFQARNNLRAMSKGDPVLFYHSGESRQVVGIARVGKTAYPDPTADKGSPWVVVDVKALEPMPKPVTLDAIKAQPKLKDMALLKLSRLSVQPVTAEEWKIVCKMGGL